MSLKNVAMQKFSSPFFDENGGCALEPLVAPRGDPPRMIRAGSKSC
jgi:hypothetical protein